MSTVGGGRRRRAHGRNGREWVAIDCSDRVGRASSLNWGGGVVVVVVVVVMMWAGGLGEGGSRPIISAKCCSKWGIRLNPALRG